MHNLNLPHLYRYIHNTTYLKPHPWSTTKPHTKNGTTTMEETVVKWRGDANEVTEDGATDMVEDLAAAARTRTGGEAVDEKIATTSTIK
jgi:hypothetical protein